MEQPTDKDIIASASEVITMYKWGDKEYHDSHEILVVALERDLAKWAKENPPGTADYTEGTPMRGVWLYRDTLEGLPRIRMHVIDDMITRPNFPKVVKKAIQSRRSKAKGSEKDRVAERFPEYRQLLSEITEAKKEWKADDARIKTTHTFRMMGGLARMGTRTSTRYHNLVRTAQKMEKDVLGKALTSAASV